MLDRHYLIKKGLTFTGRVLLPGALCNSLKNYFCTVPAPVAGMLINLLPSFGTLYRAGLCVTSGVSLIFSQHG